MHLYKLNKLLINKTRFLLYHIASILSPKASVKQTIFETKHIELAKFHYPKNWLEQ